MYERIIVFNTCIIVYTVSRRNTLRVDTTIPRGTHYHIYFLFPVSYFYVYIHVIFHCVSRLHRGKVLRNSRKTARSVPEFNKIRDVASTRSHFVAARVESLRKFRQPPFQPFYAAFPIPAGFARPSKRFVMRRMREKNPVTALS